MTYKEFSEAQTIEYQLTVKVNGEVVAADLTGDISEVLAESDKAIKAKLDELYQDLPEAQDE